MPNPFLSTVGSTVGSTARKGYRAIVPIAIRRRVRARLSPPAKPRSPAPRPPATRRFELHLPRPEGAPGGSAKGRSSLVIEAPGRLFVAKTLHQGGLAGYEPETQALLLGLAESLRPERRLRRRRERRAVRPPPAGRPRRPGRRLRASSGGGRGPEESRHDQRPAMYGRGSGRGGERWHRHPVHLAHRHIDLAPAGISQADGRTHRPARDPRFVYPLHGSPAVAPEDRYRDDRAGRPARRDASSSRHAPGSSARSSRAGPRARSRRSSVPSATACSRCRTGCRSSSARPSSPTSNPQEDRNWLFAPEVPNASIWEAVGRWRRAIDACEPPRDLPPVTSGT